MTDAVIAGLGKVSKIGLGSMIFAPRMHQLAFELLDLFLEFGGNLIDTAEIYGLPEGYGLAETVIGRWLTKRNAREKVVILSKGCIPHTCSSLYDGRPSEISEGGIHRAIDGSLARLQSEYIDLWMLHRDDPSVPVEIIVDALNDEIAQGRIRAFGVSNWTTARIAEANAYAEDMGFNGIVASSIQYSLARANEPYWPGAVHATESILQWHKTQRFPLIAWSALSRGFFSGRVDPEDQPYDPAINPDLFRTYYSGDNFERLRRAKALGRDTGLTAAEIAVAYLANQSFPVVALVMPQNTSQLASAFKGIETTLTEKELDWLDLKRSEI